MRDSVPHLRLFLLVLCLVLVPDRSVEARLTSQPTPAGEVEEAISAFQKALRRSDQGARKKALAKVVSFGDPAAHEVLLTAVSKASDKVREARDSVRRAEVAIERKRRVVKDLEIRSKKDGSLNESLNRQRNELSNLRTKLDSAKKDLQSQAPWLEDLKLGLGTMASAMKPAAKKKYGKSLLKDLAKEPKLDKQIGLLEMLGELGGADAPKQLTAHMNKVEGQRLKAKRTVAKAKREIQKAENDMGEKVREKKGPAAVGAAQQNYMRKVRELTKVQQEAVRLGFQLDAAAEAIGRLLERQSGDELATSLKNVAKATSKASGGLQRKYLAALRLADSDDVRRAIVESLATTKPDDVIELRGLLLGLATPKATEIGYDAALAQLESEHWQVRAAAIAALAGQRTAKAIPVFIERLKAEDGRLRGDLASALTSLTAKSFRSNHAAWSRWWKAEGGDGFQVVEEETEAEGSLTLEEEMGVTFFGIRTESQRVLFVLDVSGSMNFSMVPRDNPGDDPSRPFDMPKGTEQSRLEVARQQLVGALGGIKDGGQFNLVLYAGDVWTWEDELVKMETEVRSDVLRFVDSLEAGGGTNIHGALMRAFDLAGVEEDGEWSEPLVDTIFVLSDGKPSLGILTSPDEILAAVRDRNEAAGIVINTIGLSGAQDAAFLAALAEGNDGEYVGK